MPYYPVLQNAYDYYKKGLAIAEKNTDHKQIFYHAINLAFLNIFASTNAIEMKKYGQLALDNCISEDKDKWELATIAEANLYLGNTETTLDYYAKAAAFS